MINILGLIVGVIDLVIFVIRLYLVINFKQFGVIVRLFVENGNFFFWGGKVKFFD